MENFSKNLSEFMANMSQKFGTGVLVNDVLVFLFLLGSISLLLAMIAFRRSAANKLPPGIERAAAMAGRVEKLEMTLNEFRIETVRNMELFRGDLGYLKQELGEIRKILRSLTSGRGHTGGGSSGGGGGFKLPDSDLEETTYPKGEDPDRLPSEPKVKADDVIEKGLSSSIAQTVTTTEGQNKPVGLATKLKKTRFGIFDKIKNLFSSAKILDNVLLDDLEAQLVTSDLGVKLSSALVSQLKDDAKQGREVDEESVYRRLKEKMLNILDTSLTADDALVQYKKSGKTEPYVIMVVGVNGVGKTTTVAKLAQRYRSSGAKVMLAAADTFRAAAVDQLRQWGDRVQVPVVSGAPEAKPATVVYDAMLAAKKEGADILIIDTAGRLHTKSNLMQELEGVRNAVSRHSEDGPHETILVVDGSTGQNALSQAREFNQAVKLTGLVVTKLDGTPKGGIVIAIKDELGIPIRYIGVGESAEDLKAFKAEEFVNAILDRSPSSEGEASVIQNVQSAHGEVRRRRREDFQAML